MRCVFFRAHVSGSERRGPVACSRSSASAAVQHSFPLHALNYSDSSLFFINRRVAFKRFKWQRKGSRADFLSMVSFNFECDNVRKVFFMFCHLLEQLNISMKDCIKLYRVKNNHNAEKAF